MERRNERQRRRGHTHPVAIVGHFFTPASCALSSTRQSSEGCNRRCCLKEGKRERTSLKSQSPTNTSKTYSTLALHQGPRDSNHPALIMDRVTCINAFSTNIVVPSWASFFTFHQLLISSTSNMRAWSTPFLRPMAPFLAGGAVTFYLINAAQEAALKSTYSIYRISLDIFSQDQQTTNNSSQTFNCIPLYTQTYQPPTSSLRLAG